MEVPPYDIKGRGIPVTGIIPKFIPIFTNSWKINIEKTPRIIKKFKPSDLYIAFIKPRVKIKYKMSKIQKI